MTVTSCNNLGIDFMVKKMAFHVTCAMSCFIHVIVVGMFVCVCFLKIMWVMS